MRISFPSGCTAELAAPSDDREPARGLVVIPDIGGLRPLFDDLCQRLADENGWAVCAPEPWPGRESMPLDERLVSVGSIDDDLLLADVHAAADACKTDLVNVIGFCMGGMFTLKAAGTGRFHRAAAFYGMIRLPEQWRGDKQREPLEYIARAERCPTMAIIGTADTWTPPDDVEALEAAGVTVVRYDGAEHGFVHDPDRPAHRPDDAADAWRRVTAFLAS
jgi:carboxymethylenebutenolidase